MRTTGCKIGVNTGSLSGGFLLTGQRGRGEREGGRRGGRERERMERQGRKERGEGKERGWTEITQIK